MYQGATMEVECPLEPQTLQTLCFRSLKRSVEFSHDYFPPQDVESKKIRLSHKINIDYGGLIKGKTTNQTCLKTRYQPSSTSSSSNLLALPAGPVVVTDINPKEELLGHDQNIINAAGLSSTSSERINLSTREIMERWPRPIWHAPWKNYRVISGHLGWVRSVAVDPSNNWFCTGSADRTIKIWDLASGRLKLTLTGHTEQIRGLSVSSKHTYMFSAGDDKQVKCWDLEQNKVIRSYHGHLSGVYCLSLHPTIDLIFTGGRDSVCRVWDIRSKMQIHALSGHNDTVCSVFSRHTDPQVVTGSHDNTIKLWDLRMGRTITTLTHHKKSIRAMALHPKENRFACASYDNIKKFNLPTGEFLHNMLSQQKTIINAMTVNEEGVLTTAGDDGSLWFWDWKSGYNFQQAQNIVQPGSLEGEAVVYAMAYDITGSRLISCGADKTIKMWKEDENATPQSHPFNFKPPRYIRRF